MVTFHNYTKAGKQIGPVHYVKLVPGKEIVVRQKWVPQETGEIVLVGRYQPDDSWRSDPGCYTRVASQTVTVVKRQLHFHSYGVFPLMKYLTEAQAGSDMVEAEYRECCLLL